ncbi:MAG TPA: MFS transporter [Chloroflexi bacterium]|nr:MFS transporter [Chloroflexota bacterium]
MPTQPTTSTTSSRPRTLSATHLWLLTAGGFYAFFIFGFIDNLKGATLSALLPDLGFSYGEGGVVLFGAYLGFMVATLLTGILADMAGIKIVLLLAGLSLTLGLAAFSVGSSLWLLTAALFVVGLGLGSIEVGGNALIVDLHPRDRGRYLNLLAVFHGVGSFVVPLLAALLLSYSFSWRQIYQLSITLAVGLALLFAIARYPRTPTSGDGLSLRVLFATGFTRRMTWYYLLITVYVAAEIGVAAWISEYLQRVKGFSNDAGSLYLSLFFAAIMLGRLAGSFVVERIGYLTIMLIATLAAIASLSLGLLGPPWLTILIPLTGFFFSIMFPTATAAVSTLPLANLGAILGVLFTFGGLGGALGPWLIGVMADIVGLERAFALTIVFCLVMLVSLLMLRRAAPKR